MVKVAIVDSNRVYATRLQDYWSKTYGGNALIVSVFADYEELLERVKKERINIVLIQSQMDVDLGLLPEKLLKIYLITGKRGGEIDGIPALPKNGNADELYKSMMFLYEEHMNIEHAVVAGQLILFTSPVGGSGSTSCAIGFGKSLAAMGMKTLYLNFENIGAVEPFLDTSQGEAMDQIFYLYESNRKNLSFSLERIVGKDASGLKYIRQCQNPIELKEKSVKDLVETISMVTEKGAFDVVIVDKSFGLDETTVRMMQIAQRVVVVTDVSAVGQRKLGGVKALFQGMEDRGEAVGSQILFIGNKASQDGGDAIGCIPYFAGCGEREVTERIAGCDIWEEIRWF